MVLLTPVVFATAARLEVRARPHVYACTHLANSASLLLPGVQPDQPAGVRGQRAGLRPVRRADGGARGWPPSASSTRCSGRFFAADLNAGGRADRRPAARRAAGVHAGRGGADAGRVRGRVGGGRQPGLGRVRGGRGPGGPGAGPPHGDARGRCWRAADLPFLLFVLGLGIVVKAVIGQRARPGAGAAAARPGPALPALLGDRGAGRRAGQRRATTCPRCWCCCRWPRRPGPARCWPC